MVICSSSIYVVASKVGKCQFVYTAIAVFYFTIFARSPDGSDYLTILGRARGVCHRGVLDLLGSDTPTLISDAPPQHHMGYKPKK